MLAVINVTLIFIPPLLKWWKSTLNIWHNITKSVNSGPKSTYLCSHLIWIFNDWFLQPQFFYFPQPTVGEDRFAMKKWLSQSALLGTLRYVVTPLQYYHLFLLLHPVIFSFFPINCWTVLFYLYFVQRVDLKSHNTTQYNKI